MMLPRGTARAEVDLAIGPEANPSANEVRKPRRVRSAVSATGCCDWPAGGVSDKAAIVSAGRPAEEEAAAAEAAVDETAADAAAPGELAAGADADSRRNDLTMRCANPAIMPIIRGRSKLKASPWRRQDAVQLPQTKHSEARQPPMTSGSAAP